MKRLILTLASAAATAAPLALTPAAHAQTPDYFQRFESPGDYARRWEDSRHNGYWLGKQWYWGQPSAEMMSRSDYRPGYRPWARGAYIPKGYPIRAMDDWKEYGLRPPGPGSTWVRTAGGDFILTALDTRLILDVAAQG